MHLIFFNILGLTRHFQTGSTFHHIFLSQGIVLVTVVDVNDNSPVFENDVYGFRVNEGEEEGATVGTVRATDQDQGENGRVRCMKLYYT